MNQASAVQLVKESFSEWSEDKVPRLAAALAYYTAFAIAPLLVIAIAVAGLVFGQEAASNQIGQQVSGLLGPTAGEAVNNMVAAASARQGGSIVATIIGVVTLLFGASGVFGELQDSLNTIWEVQLKPGLGFFATLKKRFFSFTMVVGVGFLLLVSLIISAALAALSNVFGGEEASQSLILKAINFAISFGVTTLLFALIFKIVPDAKVQWRDVWIGAVVTALLFTLGKAALGWYLGRPGTTSPYGAAGSFVALLLWVYYSAQILFLGAEFTQVYAKMYGSKIQPDEDAVPVTEEARAEQGMPRREQVEQTAALKEHEVGGGDRLSSSNGDRGQAVGSSNGDHTAAISSSNGVRAPADSRETPHRQPGGAAAVAGFLVGLVIGRRQRMHK